MIGGILVLCVLGTVLYSLVRATAGRHGAGQHGPGAGHGGDLRDELARFFRLALLFAAAVLVAEGLAGLVDQTVRVGGDAARDPTAIARSLAFSVVGVPVLFGLSRWTARRLHRDPDEILSPGWANYVTVMVSVALLMTLTAGIDSADWLVRARSFDAHALGRLVVWGALWTLHWRLARRRQLAGAPWPAPMMLIGSAVGLVVLAFGAGQTVRAALRLIYDRAFFSVVIGQGTASLRRALVVAALGALTWWWYWLRHTVHEDVAAHADNDRHAFALLLGVLGGLSVAVIGAARLLHAALQWAFGDPTSSTAAAHFASAPTSVAIASVGGALWWYHRSVLGGGRPAEARREADRVYLYLAAAVGLVTSTVAVTMAGAALCEAVAGTDTLAGSAPVANAVVLALTLAAVGVPVWVGFWHRAQRFAHDPADRYSLTRRVYLLMLFGVAAAVALVALLVLLYLGFEDIARGRFAGHTLVRIRIPLGLVLATGAVAGYHAVIYREDRAGAPPPAPPVRPPVGEIIVLATDGEDLAHDLATSLGSPVRLWRRLEPADAEHPALAPAGAIVQAVRDHAAAHLLVIARSDGDFELIAFDPDTTTGP